MSREIGRREMVREAKTQILLTISDMARRYASEEVGGRWSDDDHDELLHEMEYQEKRVRRFLIGGKAL